MHAIKERIDATDKDEIFVCLMFDEMSIRQGLYYDNTKRKFRGLLVDYGFDIANPENLPEKTPC